ncbi:MAG TPA: hypothetical protein VNK95_16235, partial [Caldilineaceae bacterium]|nr:hypothetical protein [Caldilineaceae bacterium]
ALYDVLVTEGALTPPDPVPVAKAVTAAEHLIPTLLAEDGVTVDQRVMGSELATFLQRFLVETSQEGGIKALLQAAFTDSETYHNTWLLGSKKSRK